MANELYDALMSGWKEDAANNPLLMLSKGFQQPIQFSSNTNPWTAIGVNMGSSLLSGLLGGYGIAQEKGDLVNRMSELGALQMGNQDPSSLYKALSSSNKDYLRAVAPVVAQDMAERQAKLADAIQQQKLQLMYSAPKQVVVGDQTKYMAFDPQSGWNYIEGLGGPRKNPVTNVNVGTDSPYKVGQAGRNEIASLPVYKQLSDIAPLWEHAKSVASQDTPAADISLISSIARINDPASTVREGEAKMNMEAQAFLDRWAGNWRSVVSGQGRLNQKVRGQMLLAAGEKIKALSEAFNTQRARIEGIYQKYGAAPDELRVFEAPKFDPYIPPGFALQRNKRTGATRLVPAQ